ncbi:MAG: hypothetical protein AB8G15_11580 [Saprospiraceae bacterium]
MKIYSYCLMSFFILLTSCTSSSDPSVTIYRTQDTKFKALITQQLANKTQIDPQVAFRSILEVYQQRDTTSITTEEPPIAIYTIYGIDNWNGAGNIFQISFAHQNVDRQDGKLYEYRISLDYPPEAFSRLPHLDQRYEVGTSLGSYKKEIEQSPGFLKAAGLQPLAVLVIKEEI